MNKEDPVAWFSTSPDGKLSNKFACKPTEGNWVEPLYAAPSKRELTCVCGAVWEGETMVHPPREREWVGLTEEEIQNLGYLSEKFDASNSEWFDRWGFARAIEAKLKEKNT
jgi:tRNA uridine 5-carbamoylmethylation protein Kti12